MHAPAYALLLVGALAGGFVSGLSGFGTALMALGIWLYVLPPSSAVPLVLTCSVIAQTATLPSMWRSFDLTLVWPFVIGGLLGVPLGTMLVAHADPKVFKLTVGVFLLVFPLALYFSKPMAVTIGGKLADAAIGFAGGILGGLAGYAVQSRPWANDTAPAMILALVVVLPSLMAAESAVAPEPAPAVSATVPPLMTNAET